MTRAIRSEVVQKTGASLLLLARLPGVSIVIGSNLSLLCLDLTLTLFFALTERVYVYSAYAVLQ